MFYFWLTSLKTLRDICIKNYKLDPAHYYTAPGSARFSLGCGIKSY